MDGHHGSIHTISYHLIFNKSAGLAGMFMTCRFENMLFGDADGDDDLDYLDFNNSDFCPGVPYSDNVKIQLYSMDDTGFFHVRNSNNGFPYFIDGKTGENLSQSSFKVVKSAWPVKLK